MASKQLDQIVKSTAVTSTVLLGAHFAPEMINAMLEVIPGSLAATARIIQNPPEKLYALAGLATAYSLAKINQHKPITNFNFLEGIVTGSATFATALVAGDVIVRQVPSLPQLMQSIYGAAYTLGGIVTGLSVSGIASSRHEMIKKMRGGMRHIWENTTDYVTQTMVKKVAATTTAVGILTYSFLPETIKAMIHPRTLSSEYAFVSGPPIGDADNTRKWIYETYKKDLENSEQQFKMDRFVLAGLIFTESGGRRYAVSCTGAAGITQFIPSTAQAHGLDSGSWLEGGLYPNRLVKDVTCDGREWKVARECRKGAERQCDFTGDNRFYPSQSIAASAQYLSGLKKNSTLKEALRKYSGSTRGDYRYSNKVIAEGNRIKELVKEL